MRRFCNRLMAAFYTAFPSVAEKRALGITSNTKVPLAWTPFVKTLSAARVALVTTAGAHLKCQAPFDMMDGNGDPSFRPIPSSVHEDELTVTHDYYDHTDARKDINIVLPFERLLELKEVGFIGSVASFHYGLMGHITGKHIDTLVNKTAPEIAALLKADSVDAVVISPG